MIFNNFFKNNIGLVKIIFGVVKICVFNVEIFIEAYFRLRTFFLAIDDCVYIL